MSARAAPVKSPERLDEDGARPYLPPDHSIQGPDMTRMTPTLLLLTALVGGFSLPVNLAYAQSEAPTNASTPVPGPVVAPPASPAAGNPAASPTDALRSFDAAPEAPKAPIAKTDAAAPDQPAIQSPASPTPTSGKPSPVLDKSRAEGGKTRIAVVEFDALNEAANQDGKRRMTAEYLVTAAVKRNIYDVVEREQIKKILDQMEFGERGVGYSSAAQKIGDLAGADLVLTGSISANAGGLRVDARLIEVGTGRIVAAEGTESPVDPGELARNLDALVGRLFSAANPEAFAKAPRDSREPLSVAVWTAKPTYKKGERIEALVSGSRDFYATAFLKRPDGRLIRLLPNAYRKDGLVRHGAPVRLPDAVDLYTLEAGSALAGAEILVFGRATPFPEIPVKPVDKGLYEFVGGPDALRLMLKGVTNVKTGFAPDAKPAELVEAVKRLEIDPAR